MKNDKVYTEKELYEACKDAYDDGFYEGRRIGCLECTLDTDGCISFYKCKRKQYKRGYYWQGIARVHNTSAEFLQMIKDLCGGKGSSVHPIKRNYKPNEKVLYEYIMNQNLVRELLPQLSLVGKEEQRLLVLEALDILKGSGWWHSEKDEIRLNQIYEDMKILNKRGR